MDLFAGIPRNRQRYWERANKPDLTAFHVWDSEYGRERLPYTEQALMNRWQSGRDVPNWWQSPLGVLQQTPLGNAKREFGLSRLKPVVSRSVPLIRIDPETMRLAVALHLTKTALIWQVQIEHARLNNGAKFIELDAVYHLLARHGIFMSKSYYLRLIDSDKGVFWRSVGAKLYHHGQVATGANLTALAALYAPDALQDLPGAVTVSIDASGSLLDIEARIYAACIASWELANNRRLKSKARMGLTISQERLAQLFNRSVRQIRTWNSTAKLKSRANYVQDANDGENVPAHAVAIALKPSPNTTIGAWRWRFVNSYLPSAPKQHSHKGQARKIRKASRETVKSLIPLEIMGEGTHGLGRCFYVTLPELKRGLRRNSRRDVQQDYFYWLGKERQGDTVGLFERVSPLFEAPITSANMRADRAVERELYGAGLCFAGAVLA